MGDWKAIRVKLGAPLELYDLSKDIHENTNVASAQQTQLDTLENLESTELPTIPLMYGADWNEYSTARITGWATQSDPYMDPAPDDPEVGYILTHLKPAS